MERWMRGTGRGVAGVVAVMALAVGIVACGDDDDTQLGSYAADSSSPETDAADATAAGTTGTEAPAADPSAPAAREQSSPTPTPRPVGTDAEYVKGICVAMAEFFRDVEAATYAISPTSPSGVAQEFAAAFWPPLTRFKEDLNQIAPPADLVPWQDTVAEELGHIAARIKAGEGLNEIARLGDRPLPDFPPEIQPRLAAAAHGVAQCAPFADVFR